MTDINDKIKNINDKIKNKIIFTSGYAVATDPYYRLGNGRNKLYDGVKRGLWEVNINRCNFSVNSSCEPDWHILSATLFHTEYSDKFDKTVEIDPSDVFVTTHNLFGLFEFSNYPLPTVGPNRLTSTMGKYVNERIIAAGGLNDVFLDFEYGFAARCDLDRGEFVEINAYRAKDGKIIAFDINFEEGVKNENPV